MVLLILLIFTLFLEVQPQKERPVITVTHDSQSGNFIIYCQIPGSENAGYDCFIYIGDENRQILKSQKPSGRTQCISALHKKYLFNQLKSVKSKVMSCSYSPEPSSSKHSPYSDKFNLTAFLPLLIQSSSRTKTSIYSALTFSTSKTTMTTLATESTTWYETTINPTAGSWLSVVLVFTGVGLFLSGLMGFICLCHFDSSDDLLTEVNYSSCQVETTSLLTSSVLLKTWMNCFTSSLVEPLKRKTSTESMTVCTVQYSY